MDSFSSLPGTGCRFYRHGVCLYEECRNPGWQTAWRCRALDKLEDDFTAYMDRAECFGLSEEHARHLWERRWESVWILPFLCPDFAPAPSDAQECCWLWGDVCLRALPPCPGRCREFILAGPLDP